MSRVTRKPVRITATQSRWNANLIGHEATSYSGGTMLDSVLRLSDEASSKHHSGYIGTRYVTIEPIDSPTETVLL